MSAKRDPVAVERQRCRLLERLRLGGEVEHERRGRRPGARARVRPTSARCLRQGRTRRARPTRGPRSRSGACRRRSRAAPAPAGNRGRRAGRLAARRRATPACGRACRGARGTRLPGPRATIAFQRSHTAWLSMSPAGTPSMAAVRVLMVSSEPLPRWESTSATVHFAAPLCCASSSEEMPSTSSASWSWLVRRAAIDASTRSVM